MSREEKMGFFYRYHRVIWHKTLILVNIPVLVLSIVLVGVLPQTAIARLHCTSTPIQITSTTGGSNFNPSINADGTRIVFESDRDITGGNADLNYEIFLFDTTTTTFTQITSTTGGSNFSPSINADGTLIAFSSDRDITGGNADLNFEIFLFDTTTTTFTQITSTTGGINSNRTPSINADGTRIAFWSTRDITGGNADLNYEIFLFDTTTTTFTQITSTTGGTNRIPSINADGTRIAFDSNRDITGGNADLNFEIFLASCALGIPTMTEWGMIIFMVLAGIGSIYYMRRRRIES